MQQLDVFSQAGLHPFHMPVGVNLTENDLPQSACVKCNRCDGYPCVLTAKGDGEAMEFARGAAGSRMSLLTRSMVSSSKPMPVAAHRLGAGGARWRVAGVQR